MIAENYVMHKKETTGTFSTGGDFRVHCTSSSKSDNYCWISFRQKENVQARIR